MDLLSRPVPKADYRIPYGANASQFGDLWLPSDHSPSPLVIFFHGGWWKSEYDLGYAGHLCAALKQRGIATWSVEYRRVGETGGGWPTTFQDAASGVNFVSTLAKKYPLDLARVITTGHSAGGHLAFWATGRRHINAESPIYLPRPQIPLRGALALAGAVDLRLLIDLAGYFTFAHDKHEVYTLMGGSPKEWPERYAAGNPGDLLPFGVPQILIQGTQDDQIPPGLPARWAENAHHAGDNASVQMLAGMDHFDVVDPLSPAFPVVLQAIKTLLET